MRLMRFGFNCGVIANPMLGYRYDDNQPDEKSANSASRFPVQFPPPRIRKNHGRLDLPFWYVPIFSEETVLLLGTNNLKALLFVKADRPYRVRPRSDQYRTWRQLPQMRQQLRSDSAILAAGGDVCVPNQSHIPHPLKAHHTCQLSSVLASPERNAAVDFMAQFVLGHIWFRPAIFRNDAFIGARTIVDDGPNRLKVVVITAADHSVWPPGPPLHAQLKFVTVGLYTSKQRYRVAFFSSSSVSHQLPW